MEPKNSYLLRELKHLLDKGETAFSAKDGFFTSVFKYGKRYHVYMNGRCSDERIFDTFEALLRYEEWYEREMVFDDEEEDDETALMSRPINDELREGLAHWEIVILHDETCECSDCKEIADTDRRYKERSQQRQRDTDEQMRQWQKLKEEYQSRKG